MTMVTRLEKWQERGVISAEQFTFLSGLSRGEPLSVFLELNILLYAGILAFVGGLGWTVSTWSEQLGAFLIVAALSAMLVACFWFCFSRPPGMVVDYVLYLGSLIWSVELGYVETRFHLLGEKSDLYLLASAALFFFLAYRFDNRLVLSLGLSSLAGWFGLTISHWSSHQDETYRRYAILYSLTVGAAGAILYRRGVKPHFLGTYLNVGANVLFWALLSGVFERQGYGGWFLALLVVCGVSLAWGIQRRQFSFVAYAAVYGYIGISSILIRGIHDGLAIFAYFFFTGIAMLVMLVVVARRFGREQ
jgi:hypothetical protein